MKQNSVFFILVNWLSNKANEQSLLYYLPIAGVKKKE